MEHKVFYRMELIIDTTFEEEKNSKEEEEKVTKVRTTKQDNAVSAPISKLRTMGTSILPAPPGVEPMVKSEVMAVGGPAEVREFWRIRQMVLLIIYTVWQISPAEVKHEEMLLTEDGGEEQVEGGGAAPQQRPAKEKGKYACDLCTSSYKKSRGCLLYTSPSPRDS